MLKNILLLTALAFVLPVTYSKIARAEATDAPRTPQEGYQEAVRSQMQELVSGTLNDYFTHNGRDVPEHIEVHSRADFDLGDREPRLRGLNLEVTMTSDQPAAVLREARQRMIKALRGSGYRFEPASTPAEALMPLVKFTLEVKGPGKVEDGNSPREYAILIALALGCVAFFCLSMLVVLQPLRRRGRKPQRAAEAAPAARDARMNKTPTARSQSDGRKDWPEAGELPPLPTQPLLFRPNARELPPLTSGQFGPDSGKPDPKLV